MVVVGCGRGRSSRSGQAISPSGPLASIWLPLDTAQPAKAKAAARARALRNGRTHTPLIYPPSQGEGPARHCEDSGEAWDRSNPAAEGKGAGLLRSARNDGEELST